MAEEKPIWITILTASFVGALVSGTMTTILDARSFERSNDLRLLEELLGPVTMHLSRTNAVHERYERSENQFFRDTLILQESNKSVRKILIEKSYLLPSNLLGPAECLVSHYDVWLNEFAGKLEAETKAGSPPLLSDRFDLGLIKEDDPVRNGLCGVGFPDAAPACFEAEFNRLRKKLFDLDSEGDEKCVWPPSSVRAGPPAQLPN